MNTEKWQKINELFHVALEIEADKRTHFVEKEANDDEEVIAEVQKLISAHEESDNFIQNPVIGKALEILSNQHKTTLITNEQIKLQSFSVGERIGHFEIVNLVGKGGMGEVFLARDKSLGRDVAIKVLLPEFTADADRLKRFQLEAKAVSALNHPNILTIYEIGETDDLHFIATEFVKGQTLTEYLRKEKSSLKKTLKIALQIISALQSAHEVGIIHRDIKPDNVMIRADGIVKVLDFGLAKLLENSNNPPSQIPNPKSTMPGLIMGTPNYMSPEQARGKDIDYQTDIFSFGVVLYEMLTGVLPFAGDSTSDIIASVLTKEPISVCELNPEIPPELEKIVRQTLHKDKQNRYQTAKSLVDELTELTEELQAQDRLEKSFVPNTDQAQTQILQITTIDKKGTTVVTEKTEYNSKSLKKYLVAGFGVILISVAGFFGYQSFFPSKQIESIAVIPFVNESGNSEIEYLSDGMTETLIKNLSNIPNLNVKARSSVFRYKGQETDLKKIASELQVQAVVTGRIVQRNDEIILSLDLVEAATEKNLWNERYTRKQSDLVLLQNEIAKDVSNNLKAKLSGEEATKFADSGTTNSEAYQAYLKGRYFLNKGVKNAPQHSLKYFQEAITLDPNFALGYAGIADSYSLIGTVMSAETSLDETMPQAKTAAEKAIELNPNLSEAHTSLAWFKFRYDWDWAGAESSFKKAIELNPNNAQAHQWYGELLACLRRDEEALDELKKARDLEPFNLLMAWNYAKVFGDFGRYEEALPEAKKIYELDPYFPRNYRILRKSYFAKGMEAEAFEILLKEITSQNYAPERIALYKEIYKTKGYEAVNKRLAEIELQENKDLNANFKAILYATLGDKENTLYWLEESYRQRLSGVAYMQLANYDFVKNEPKYKELLRKMNFPQN